MRWWLIFFSTPRDAVRWGQPHGRSMGLPSGLARSGEVSEAGVRARRKCCQPPVASQAAVPPYPAKFSRTDDLGSIRVWALRGHRKF